MRRVRKHWGACRNLNGELGLRVSRVTSRLAGDGAGLRCTTVFVGCDGVLYCYCVPPMHATPDDAGAPDA